MEYAIHTDRKKWSMQFRQVMDKADLVEIASPPVYIVSI